MPEIAEAEASPEKRLFISLLTRDLSLIDAFLDLIDNSINAALITRRVPLSSARDYMRLLNANARGSLPSVTITANDRAIKVADATGGITFETARSQVFKFGKSESPSSSSDRLSVYGIGLKRAIFKMGNNVHIESNHRAGGFALDLNVPDGNERRNSLGLYPSRNFDRRVRHMARRLGSRTCMMTSRAG